MKWGVFRPSGATVTCFWLLGISMLLMSFRLSSAVLSFRHFLFYWVSPSYEVVFTMMETSKGWGNRLTELVFAHHENAVLKEKIQRFNLLQSQFREIFDENQRLRHIIQVQSKKLPGSTAALVFSRDMHNWTQSVWINQGTTRGLKPNDTVLAVSGDPVDDEEVFYCLVGRIQECGTDSSKVLLISDPLSSVAVSVTRTEEQGLLQGQGAFAATIEYLNQTADIAVGDEIVTSGLGGIFPPGILLGYVQKVMTTSKGFKRAEVQMAIPLSKIKEVLVLSPSKEIPKQEFSTGILP